MEDLVIRVNKIEELQTINDTAALDELFQRAKRVLVGGGAARRYFSKWSIRFVKSFLESTE